MCEFKISDVTAINRNISVQRESGSEAIRVDLRCCIYSWAVEVEELMWDWVEWSWADYFSVCAWVSCRGAEQLMVNLLDGWRRCSECFAVTLCECWVPQAWCRSIEWCPVRHVGILLPSYQTIRLYCYRGQRSAEYLLSKVRWVLLFIGDFDFTVRSV